MGWARSADFTSVGQPLDYYFDKIYTSYEIKEVKPSRAIFEHMIKDAGLLPHETLFVDDGAANIKMAKELGYYTFFWSLAYVDWDPDNQPTKEEAFEKLTGRIHPGAIVLLHNTSKTNGEILDELLTKWEEMGYHFGTLDELIAGSNS